MRAEDAVDGWVCPSSRGLSPAMAHLPPPRSPAPLPAAGPANPLAGKIRVPGDKSISHRALMLGALAIGRTEISGLLEGEDVLATAAALNALGASITRGGGGHSTPDRRSRGPRPGPAHPPRPGHSPHRPPPPPR